MFKKKETESLNLSFKVRFPAIHLQINEMGKDCSQVDAVFRKALIEFRSNLMSSYSISLHVSVSKISVY